MGLFNKKIRVTFIDKKWNRIKDNIAVVAVPKVGELVYLGKGEDYYRVTQVINWPSANPKIFIVVESLTEMEGKYKKILDNYKGNETDRDS